MYLVKDERPQSVIILSRDYEDSEYRAAVILQNRLAKRAKVKIEIRKEDEVEGNRPEIKILLGKAKEGIFSDILREPVGISGQEGFILRTIYRDGYPYILLLGADDKGVLYGVGKFLRNIEFSEGNISISELNINTVPFHELRGEFLANHNQDVAYKNWPVDLWKDYIEELALWGVNTIFYLPIQFGQRNSSIWYGTDEEKAQWEVCAQIPTIVKSLGLDVGIYLGANDVFADQLDGLKAALRGRTESISVGTEQAHVCPSGKKERELILKLREELFQKLPYIDYLFIPSTDYGGCACGDCDPYVITYLKLVSETAELLWKYHKNAKVIISNQFLTAKGQKMLCEYLQRERPTWLHYIAYGHGANAINLKEMLERVPSSYKIILYQDITMRGGWGKNGATPWVMDFNYDVGGGSTLDSWVQESADGHPEVWKFEEVKDRIYGSFPYSEGIHDDINKVLWCQVHWDPGRDRGDILKEYCDFYYGKDVSGSIIKAVLLMEKVSDLETAQEILSLLLLAEQKMFDLVKESWRWKILKIRGEKDVLNYGEGILPPEEISQLKGDVQSLAQEIYQLCRQTALWP